MVSIFSTHHRQSTGAIIALCVAATFLSAPCQARDRGLNQPGAIGNHPVGVDPGINQPGALGNRGRGRFSMPRFHHPTSPLHPRLGGESR
jgi:hypothetical protein